MKKHWWVALILVLVLALPAVASQAIKISVDGKELKTDVPAQIIDGRTMVPIRAIAEYFGKTVDYDNVSKTVTITGMSDVEKINKIFSEASVAHGQAKTNRAGACAACHDGNGFLGKELVSVREGNYDVVANHTTLMCESCHTGPGKELLDAGKVQLPFMAKGELYQAGAGALCMNCHNGRRDPAAEYVKFNESGKRTAMSYPHYGGASILTGKGGMEIPGYTYESTFMHTNIQDSCVSCHMPKTKADYTSHEFYMNEAYVQDSCGSCHAGINTFDYRGVQTEIYEMNKKLKAAAIAAVPGAVNVQSGSGRLQFIDAAGKEIPMGEVSQAAYVAAFNWYTIYGDKSKGIHNPKYARSLIKNSYKNVTGQDL